MTMSNSSGSNGGGGGGRPKAKGGPKALAAVIVGSCAVASLFDAPSSFLRPMPNEPPSSSRSSSTSEELLRRQLLVPPPSSSASSTTSALDVAAYPWARTKVAPLSEAPDRSRKEIALFWHIPKSGGSTAKAFYRCLGKVVDVESQPGQIKKSEQMGLVLSGKVDVIFSSYPDFAIDHLFDPDHKARALAMFRHPVDRLISKFYYLQVATWEKTYRPDWKEIDVLDWVKMNNLDNDHMVKKLAGKLQRDTATETDLQVAMTTLRQSFVVGLMREMEESIGRFNVVMGINDETEKKHRGCTNKFFGQETKKRNAHEHPKVEKGNPAWDLLAEKNALDIRLYEFVLELYEEQREIVASYASGDSISVSDASPPHASGGSISVSDASPPYASGGSISTSDASSRW